MNNLEKLYKKRKELDKVLEEIKTEQFKMRNIITEKRNAGWDKMFEDLYSFKKYSNFIDTGIGLYERTPT